MKFKVTTNGEAKTYGVPPRVEIRWEKNLKRPVAEMKSQDDLYRMAHLAVVDAGDNSDAYEVWIEHVDDVTPLKGDETPLADDPPSGEPSKSLSSPVPASP